MSFSLVRQFDTDRRIAERPSQTVPLSHASPPRWTCGEQRIRGRVVSKRKSTWFRTTSFSDLQPGSAAIAAANCAGASAGASTSPRRRIARATQRGVDRESPRAARELGRPVHRVACRARSRARGIGRAGSSPLGAPPGGRQNARPLSYGTLSHLCASVAQESACSAPAVRWRSAGEAAAHRPNAPSTCSQAPASLGRRRDLVEAGRRRQCSPRLPARRRSSGR